MKAFIEPLQELSGYEDMTKAAMQPGLVTISGCIDAQKPHMILHAWKDTQPASDRNVS